MKTTFKGLSHRFLLCSKKSERGKTRMELKGRKLTDGKIMDPFFSILAFQCICKTPHEIAKNIYRLLMNQLSKQFCEYK